MFCFSFSKGTINTKNFLLILTLLMSKISQIIIICIPYTSIFFTPPLPKIPILRFYYIFTFVFGDFRILLIDQ